MINELTTAQIESLVELYIGYFTRAPEASGLNYWKGEYISRLNAGQGDNQALTEIADLFYSAALQYSDQTGYSADDTPAEFIQKIYANVLLRTGTLAPPAEDIAYWEEELASGRVSLGGLVKRMISDAKAFDGDPQWGFVADTLASRKVVAAAWAQSEEGQAIGGAEAVLRGKAILSSIDATDASREQALGVIADLDSGDTTVFSGPNVDKYADGTIRIDENINARGSTTVTPNSILVANGADLIVDGRILMGGEGGELTVRGESSSLLVRAAIDTATNSRFTAEAGGSTVINIANGADVTFEKNFSLADFTVRDDGNGNVNGVVGGDALGTLNVVGGGTLTVKGDALFAVFGTSNDAIGDGTETGTAEVLVTGSGSRIDLQGDFVQFARSENATATLTILNGGVVQIDGGAGFGRENDAMPNAGGDATIVVRGDGSQLVSGGDVQIGDYSSSQVSLMVDDGGLFRTAGFDFARVGATGDLTVSDNGRLEITQYNNIGQFAGSKVDVLVTTGGVITSTNNFNFGSFDLGNIFDDGFRFQGIANGKTEVDIEVSAGGELITDRGFNLAFRFEPQQIAQGAETAEGRLTITGAGSLVESKSDWGNFGVSAGAVAVLNVLDGGLLLLGEGGGFGAAADDNPAKGGTAIVTVDGEGSAINVHNDTFLTRGGLDFGRGENANATVTVSNGGLIEGRGLYFGSDGGKATATVDGGMLKVYGGDEDGFARWLEIGRQASSQGESTLIVQNGGSININGQGTRSPGLGIAEEAGGKGSLVVTGAGSTVTIINDKPIGVGGNTQFGNSIVNVGRNGDGSLTISDGAIFTNSANGVFDLGADQGGDGKVILTGAGSVLNYGAAFVLAGGSNGGGVAELSIMAGATLNQTGVIKDPNGDFFGVHLRGEGAALWLDSTSVFNSDLRIEEGRFIVEGTTDASVKINGDFEHDGGVLEMELGTGVHDMLDVSGLLDLDGLLNIKLLGGFAPVNGTTFALFTANDIEVGGNFDLVVDGLDLGLDAQLQITNGVAVLAISDTPVSDFIFL